MHGYRGGKPGHGEVIPAPASVLLGMLGLPILWIIRRRQKAVTPATATDA